MHTVLVVGSANLDHVYRVPSLPVEGQTLHATSYQTYPGGKGMNQAVACARMGARVAFCGCLGTDSAGDELLSTMEEFGVDVTYVQRSEGLPTGNASIMVDDRGRNQITVAGGSNSALDPVWVAEVLDRVKPNMVLAQLETPMACVKAASRHNHFVLNPAPASPLPDDVVAGCLALTPNETEAFALTGIMPTDEASCRECAEVLRAKGATNVVLTLGSAGSYWLGPEGMGFIPTLKVDSVDTTAAGDVFNGALVAELVAGAAFVQALRLASVAAALSTTKPGAIASIPTRAEVESALARLSAS